MGLPVPWQLVRGNFIAIYNNEIMEKMGLFDTSRFRLRRTLKALTFRSFTEPFTGGRNWSVNP